MTFLIDGYNLIFFIFSSKEDLRSLRKKLVSLLQNAFETQNLSGLLIFDGTFGEQKESSREYNSSLISIYTQKGQTADQYILEVLQGAKIPQEYTVVSNDKHLLKQARELGSKTKENRSFLKSLTSKKSSEKAKEVKETPQNIKRLKKIFEQRLKELDEDF